MLGVKIIGDTGILVKWENLILLCHTNKSTTNAEDDKIIIVEIRKCESNIYF